MRKSNTEPVESPQDSTSMVAIRASRSRRSRPGQRTSYVCVALGLLVAGCIGSSTPSDGPPVYAGTTCAELAREWGDEVDRRITTIIDGPDVVNEMAKSSRNIDALALTSTALSVHMDHLGLLNECDMPEFLPIAEQEFSDQLRSGAGEILHDGEPVATYDEWYSDMQRFLGVIDFEDTD
jgi:hypothetical protein